MSKKMQYFAFSGKSSTCYGLHIVSESLRRHGWEIEPFNASDKCDVMVSLYWPEQLLDFIMWRYKSHMKGRRIIVGGNYATTSPSAVLPFCDAIFLGDGESWGGSWESENVITKDKPFGIVKREERIMPCAFSDVQDNMRDFVEISRGCKNKCLFCQYGWLKPYRESNIVDCVEVLKRCKTRTIRVFAADRFQHTKYPEIRAWLEKNGKTDSGSDVSINFLLQNPEWLRFTNKVRVGVEGCSYFMRKLIGKPYSNDDLARFCGLVVDAGIKCLDWYMIYGLPGERESDAVEFMDLVRRVDSILPVGYTICLHWNAFTPSAQTPLQWAAASTTQHDYLIKNLKNKLPGQRAKWMHKPLATNQWTVIRRMLCIRSAVETRDLVFSFANQEAKWKAKPQLLIDTFDKMSPVGLINQLPIETQLPWDKHLTYKRDLMARLYGNVLRKTESR
jgi:radical SAM superfamily enzyme YgiQ (UPF0313 family)